MIFNAKKKMATIKINIIKNHRKINVNKYLNIIHCISYPVKFSQTQNIYIYLFINMILLRANN